MCVLGPQPTSSANAESASEKASPVTVGSNTQLVLPLGGLDKAIEIHPLLALPHHGADTAPTACPNPPQDGFESTAMVIAPPQVHRCCWIGLTNQLDLFWQLFYKLAALVGCSPRAEGAGHGCSSPDAACSPNHAVRLPDGQSCPASTTRPLARSRTHRHPGALARLGPTPCVAPP